jgi:hypothetical protein
MHFFYIDETGDTGTDLLNSEQPIFVMGGISLSDEKWNSTQETYQKVINSYFSGSIPLNFELHAHELLSPKGDGPFAGHDRNRRNQLALDVLSILDEHRHHIHAIAFCKKSIDATTCGIPVNFDVSVPYLLGFDYLITQFNNHIKYHLGSSARGLMILDKKEEHHANIEAILHDRRFQTVSLHRVKWVVEFSYPIDSTKNPMIQISDLAIFSIRKFLEVEHGYGDKWPQPAKDFFAQCYSIIDSRLTIKRGIIDRPEPKLKLLNKYIEDVTLKPIGQWRRKYNL